MTFRFICFVKYLDNKFDLVIDHEFGPFEKNFGEIRPKIAEIFKIALNQELDSESLDFELTDGAWDQTSMITSFDQKIRHLSVITIKQKALPVLLSPPVTMTDPDLQYLKNHTMDIIAFYLMIDAIDPNIELKDNTDQTWTAVANRVLEKFPYIFGSYTADKCRQLFNGLSRFYILSFNKLNNKVDPSTQRRFDMLKIVHLLNPDRAFDAQLSFWIKQLAKELQDYIEQQNRGFDQCLNTHRIFEKYITYEEFQDFYLRDISQSQHQNFEQTLD